MNMFHAPAFTATAAVASILAATVLMRLDTPTWRPLVAAHAPAHFECRFDVTPGHGTLLRLTNTGLTTLPAGARFSWVTLGTPSPQGEVRQLPHALPPGGSVGIRSALVAAGAGCAAVLFD